MWLRAVEVSNIVLLVHNFVMHLLNEYWVVLAIEFKNNLVLFG